MKCINEKNQHIGELLTISRKNMDGGIDGIDSVVRWCPECGAIVVDQEVDGRIMGKYMDMSFPKALKEYRKSNE